MYGGDLVTSSLISETVGKPLLCQVIVNKKLYAIYGNNRFNAFFGKCWPFPFLEDLEDPGCKKWSVFKQHVSKNKICSGSVPGMSKYLFRHLSYSNNFSQANEHFEQEPVLNIRATPFGYLLVFHEPEKSVSLTYDFRQIFIVKDSWKEAREEIDKFFDEGYIISCMCHSQVTRSYFIVMWKPGNPVLSYSDCSMRLQQKLKLFETDADEAQEKMVQKTI